jgi:hypothetical protein
MTWPRSRSPQRNRRSTIRWQHRLNRERPTCTERRDSLLESANGSMAVAATRREAILMKKTNESTRLPPPLSWQPVNASFTQQIVNGTELKIWFDYQPRWRGAPFDLL